MDNKEIIEMDKTELSKLMLIRSMACFGRHCETREECQFYCGNKWYILDWVDLSQIEEDKNYVCGKFGNYKIFSPIKRDLPNEN